jgi:hypothetical protein
MKLNVPKRARKVVALSIELHCYDHDKVMMHIYCPSVLIQLRI